MVGILRQNYRGVYNAFLIHSLLFKIGAKDAPATAQLPFFLSGFHCLAVLE